MLWGDMGEIKATITTCEIQAQKTLDRLKRRRESGKILVEYSFKDGGIRSFRIKKLVDLDI